jgi:uncharacterized protein (TIGR03435 family)
MRPILFTSCLSSLFALALSAGAQSQPNATKQATVAMFQAATIKPSKPDEPLEIQIQGRRFATAGTSLVDVMKYAYGVHGKQIVGGPEWIGTEKFDLLADPGTENRPASDEMKRMVQELLSDRFQLTFHRDKRELSVYAIVVGKAGAKLTKSEGDPSGIPAVAFSPSGKLGAGNATIADFATFLQRYVMDRPVVDQTGITGRYDLRLTWTPDESQFNGRVPPATDDPNAPPGLYTAIQEQLGLNLEAVKAPVEVLVIDRVERPSEN